MHIAICKIIGYIKIVFKQLTNLVKIIFLKTKFDLITLSF